MTMVRLSTGDGQGYQPSPLFLFLLVCRYGRDLSVRGENVGDGSFTHMLQPVLFIYSLLHLVFSSRLSNDGPFLFVLRVGTTVESIRCSGNRGRQGPTNHHLIVELGLRRSLMGERIVDGRL